PRRRATALLSDGISGDANRSRLRRSTIVRGLSHHLLYRPRAGIVLRDRNRRRDPRLPTWFAQTAPQSALFVLAKRVALLESAHPILSLQCQFASFCSVGFGPWTARSAGRATSRSAFSHQSSSGRAKDVDD